MLLLLVSSEIACPSLDKIVDQCVHSLTNDLVLIVCRCKEITNENGICRIHPIRFHLIFCLLVQSGNLISTLKQSFVHEVM